MSREDIAREIVRKALDYSVLPDNPEAPDTNTYLMDLIIDALKAEKDAA